MHYGHKLFEINRNNSFRRENIKKKGNFILDKRDFGEIHSGSIDKTQLWENEYIKRTKEKEPKVWLFKITTKSSKFCNINLLFY